MHTLPNLEQVTNLKKFERSNRVWPNSIPQILNRYIIFVCTFGAIAQILRKLELPHADKLRTTPEFEQAQIFRVCSARFAKKTNQMQKIQSNPNYEQTGRGQNFEWRNLERLIFRNFKIANIKKTKDALFDSFIFELIFFHFLEIIWSEILKFFTL